MKLSNDVIRGQKVYNKFTLAIYDIALFKILTGNVWRCPTKALLAQYDNNITANHLDVGVGSGYLLDNCTYPSPSPKLALMDVNSECLYFCARRLERFSPETFQCNVLASIDTGGAKFDSIGMNYLLHCLPGSFAEKAVVFDHLFELLNPGGVLFGTTVVSNSDDDTWYAEKLLSIYNKKGVFSNKNDSIDALGAELSKRYKNFSITQTGYAVQFTIKKVDK